MSRPDNESLEVLERAAMDGSRRAGDALSTMLGRAVQVQHLETRYIESASGAILMSLEVQHDQAAIGRIEVSGSDVRGRAFVVMSNRAISELLATYEIEHEPQGELGDMALSMLREVSNITASSYLNALADAWKIELNPSPVTLELAATGLSDELEAAAQRQGPALVFRCEFVAEQGACELSLVMLVSSSDVRLFAQTS